MRTILIGNENHADGNPGVREYCRVMAGSGRQAECVEIMFFCRGFQTTADFRRDSGGFANECLVS